MENLPKNELKIENVPKKESKMENLPKNELKIENAPTNVIEKKKKKKGFKAIASLKLPAGMDKLMNSIQAPLKEVEKMMAEEDQLAEENFSAQRSFHSMSL